MPHTEIHALCQQVQSGWEELAHLRNEENDSKPRAPATARDVQALKQVWPDLPADYLAFLEMHDGWSDYWYGGRMLSAREVAARDNLEIDDILEIEAENGHDLSNVRVIGYYEGQSDLVFIDSMDGATVEYKWGDGKRHPSFTAYLQSIVEHQQHHIEQVRARLELLENGKNQAYRDANERAVIARAIEQLRSAPPYPAATPIRLDCVPAYVRRLQWTDKAPLLQTDAAYVQLVLSLYLAYNPTSEEMREALRGWRRHFPWDGKVSAAPYNYCPFFNEITDPNDEIAWAPFLSEQAGTDMYGFGWIEHKGECREAAPEARSFSVRAFSYVEDHPAASLCLVTLPMDGAPEPLIGLAQELCRTLPVRSGLAGFQARWSAPEGIRACDDWRRRFHGLDLQDSNHVYPALREGIRGANWLTILGRGLAAAYEGTTGFAEFEEPGIQIFRDDASIIVRAGEHPTLGDVASGEQPKLYAAVERRILPLKIGTADDVQRVRVFTQFQIEDEGYGSWLYRLTDPNRLLEYTVRELSQLLEEVAKEGTPEEINDLVERLRVETPEVHTSWHACNAGYYAGARGFQEHARALYEFALSCPKPIPQIVANLIVTYLLLCEIDLACEFAENQLHRGKELPVIYFNAACAFGEKGDAERALELTRRAITEGYTDFDAIKSDTSLALLANDRRFHALFPSHD